MNRRIRTNIIQFGSVLTGYGSALAVIYRNGVLVTFANVDVSPGETRIRR